jgi:hypothetical protein
MDKAGAMQAERGVQRKFSFGWMAAALALLATVGLFDEWLSRFPDRQELGWRTSSLERHPVALDARAFAPFRLAGAWRLTSSDPRFGGISALAIDQGQLVALSDSGAVIRFSPFGGPARIGDLPGGPRSKSYKVNRDSEALVAAADGRGWWVAFETRNQLWLYDRTFARAQQRIRLGRRGGRRNYGIEGAVRDGQALLLLHEAGDKLLRLTPQGTQAMSIAGARAELSDAVGLDDGRWLVVERQLTPLGFRNALVILERHGGGYRYGRRFPLPVGRLDNVEAIALESRTGGGRRLWLMTDDNFQPRLRTLLIALDMPASAFGEGLRKN